MSLYIGVDVSKLKLDICVLNNKEVDYFTIINNQESIQGFISYIKECYKVTKFYFGYEATNNYMLELQKEITEKEYKQIMINPFRLNHYLKSLDTRTKTDIKDCFGIAKYISTLEDKDFTTSYNYEIAEFKKHNTTLSLLEKMLTQLKNLQKSQKQIKTEELDNDIKDLEVNLKKLKDKIEKVAIKKMNLILPATKKIKADIKGVGNSLLMQLTPTFLQSTKFDIKQMQCYFGLSPKISQSGTSINISRLSKQGNSKIRKILYMSTISAIKFNEIIKEKYKRLIKNGKKAKVALVACMAHLLRAVFIKFNEYQLVK